jgi:ribonuclease HI
MTVIAYCDGCCEPRNPNGVATYAIVVVDAVTGEVLDEKADIIAIGEGATNNLAQLMAVGAALKWALEHDATKVTVKTDSQLAVNLLTGLWQPTPTKPYYPAFRGAMRLLKEAERQGIEVRLEWIPRRQNERADFLAKRLAMSVFNSLPKERQVALAAGSWR